MKRVDLPDDVLQRRALIYVRQSTGAQVHDNLESQRRQYDLADLARTYGFSDVVTIDDDLGRSASGLVGPPGLRGARRAPVSGGGRRRLLPRSLAPGAQRP